MMRPPKPTISRFNKSIFRNPSEPVVTVPVGTAIPLAEPVEWLIEGDRPAEAEELAWELWELEELVVGVEVGVHVGVHVVVVVGLGLQIGGMVTGIEGVGGVQVWCLCLCSCGASPPSPPSPPPPPSPPEPPLKNQVP